MDARARLHALLGASDVEERQRMRWMSGFARRHQELDAARLASLADSARGYCHARCCDELKVDLERAVLERGSEALEVFRAWLAEWEQRFVE